MCYSSCYKEDLLLKPHFQARHMIQDSQFHMEHESVISTWETGNGVIEEEKCGSWSFCCVLAGMNCMKVSVHHEHTEKSQEFHPTSFDWDNHGSIFFLLLSDCSFPAGTRLCCSLTGQSGCGSVWWVSVGVLHGHNLHQDDSHSLCWNPPRTSLQSLQQKVFSANHIQTHLCVSAVSEQMSFLIYDLSAVTFLECFSHRHQKSVCLTWMDVSWLKVRIFMLLTAASATNHPHSNHWSLIVVTAPSPVFTWEAFSWSGSDSAQNKDR